jgi:transcription elongation factor GreA
MAQEKIILTREGYDKIKIKLKQLEEVERKKVAEDIKEAQSFGDISENAEFDDAKNRQAMLEQEVAELKNILQHAQIVSTANLKDKITIGSKIVLESKEGTENYEIVGDLESEPLNGKISYQSPIGRALMGQAKGDSVYITTPRGKREAKIVEIS